MILILIFFKGRSGTRTIVGRVAFSFVEKVEIYCCSITLCLHLHLYIVTASLFDSVSVTLVKGLIYYIETHNRQLYKFGSLSVFLTSTCCSDSLKLLVFILGIVMGV